MKIELPYNFEPRPYQLSFWQAMQTKRRAICVWHRRSGKDKNAWNFTIAKSQERVGTYYYIFPSYAQAKKVIWNGMDKAGFRFLNHVPAELLAENGKNETDMLLKMKNGSIIQLIGSDNIDSIVGPNPVGVVLSEYALQDPKAWEFLRPILRENDGWAVFLFTPRGQNFAYRMLRHNERNADWFTQVLTVADTGYEHLAEAERLDGMDEELLQQEYYCSFSGSMTGAYYAKQIELAEKEGRITDVPYDSRFPVETWWDIGIGDSTAIWFVQSNYYTGKLSVIDYHEASGEALPYYAAELKSRKWPYEVHILPHDASHRNPETGSTYWEAAEGLGIDPITIAPKLPVPQGIDAVRRLFPRMYFDKTKCARGIDCLQNYRKKPLSSELQREGDEERLTAYSNIPVHDWTSHGADAFRTGALGRSDVPADAGAPQVEGLDFEVYS